MVECQSAWVVETQTGATKIIVEAPWAIFAFLTYYIEEQCEVRGRINNREGVRGCFRDLGDYVMFT